MKDMIYTRRDSLRKAPLQLPLQQRRYQRSHSQDVSLRQRSAMLERQLTADCQAAAAASFPEEANGLTILANEAGLTD